MKMFLGYTLSQLARLQIELEYGLTSDGLLVPEALGTVHPDIEAGITAFMGFTNAALDEWFFRAQERGAKFFDFGERSTSVASGA